MSITLSNICKAYGERRVLRGVTLDIPQGVTCLMGPSGCGKTTLLRILTGLEAPDCGEITGVPARIAMVFQEDRLVDSLTVRANLRLALGAGYDPADAQALLNELDLPDALRRTVGELSGGMKRRVALVRAMAADSEIVLLDEPFTGLDSRNSKKAAEYILSEQRGRTVISVTHDMEMCKMLGAGICLLTSGKAVATIL